MKLYTFLEHYLQMCMKEYGCCPKFPRPEERELRSPRPEERELRSPRPEERELRSPMSEEREP
jgi:hypothetical protein